MTPGNWIEDENKFRLAKPPDWWLQRLFDFDHMLVVLPSRKSRNAYLLTRRRQHTAGLGDVAMVDNKHPDTNMCYVHGVLPIAPLNIKKGAQNPFSEDTITSLISELKRRDTWQFGKNTETALERGDKYALKVIENEQAAEEKDRANMRDKFYHMARDAWRSLQARTKQRNKRASDHHGVARNRKRKAGSQPST